ncbi:hypothetical protein FRC12_013850 [Ceratobasidium sp. 428]|nr:hypothetical protein FRC12_013850 [Ceratobasidium sp. 428]
MTAEEICVQERLNRERTRRERRDRAAMLPNPPASSKNVLTTRAYNPLTDDSPVLDVPTSTVRMKDRARVSLGTSATVLSAQLPYTHAKGKGHDMTLQQKPTRGYLASMLQPQGIKNAPGPSQSAVYSTSTPAPLPVASGGKPGSGDSEGSSSSDNEYKKLSKPEQRTYEKVKKEMREKLTRSAEEKECEKRQRKKIEKLKLSGYKTKLPTIYDRSADFDVHEQWIFGVNTWIRDTGFDETETMNHMILFLSDKAGTYYLDNVAPRPWEYNFNRVTVELFEHCFPPDINARLRQMFTGMKQTDRGLKDFIRLLQKYQRRLSDLTDRQVAQRIWEGAHSYLGIEWAKAGYSAKTNTVQELEESGIRFEMAEKIRRNEEDRREQKENRDQRPNKPNQLAYRVRPHTPRNPKEKRDWKAKRNPKQGPQLTKEQVEQYRVAGKCFNCSKVGHTAKDCPKRNQAKPSTLSSSAVRFAHIDNLDTKRRGLEVNNIDIDSDSSYGDDESNLEEEESGSESEESDLEEDKSDGNTDTHNNHKTLLEQINEYIELYGAKVKKNKERGEPERNAAMPKHFEQKVA